ncbi:LppU/SCO3897 family protein [Streptomyces sp. WM4235]|uniref:LppU/SCO3897 family protein n=1 Tax=Streptomyces sp. WM4235 TaxID=1415551 RepID=UPI0006AED0CF|nr:hypothetical protein [Streptomyces sp. WM4235]
MSPQEIPLTITPQQAAHGVILTVALASGPARLRIPSCTDGQLVRARVGDTDVLLRIRVGQVAGAAPGQPAAPGKSGAKGCLVAVGLLAAVIVGVVLLNNGDDDKVETSPTPSPTISVWSPAPAPPPVVLPTSTTSTGTSAPDPTPSPSEAAPSPFDRGTCLNGTLPDSTTAQRVTGVREVPCSASDAHYRVIESIPMTSDLDRCNDNPKTEYAFSYSYTRNGIPLNEYVYCLVGMD